MRCYIKEAELNLFFPFISPSVKSLIGQEGSHSSTSHLILSSLLNSTKTSQKVSQINHNTAKQYDPSQHQHWPVDLEQHQQGWFLPHHFCSEAREQQVTVCSMEKARDNSYSIGPGRVTINYTCHNYHNLVHLAKQADFP